MKHKDIDPHTLLVSSFLRVNIADYRKGNDEAKKFLFEENYLPDFLKVADFHNLEPDWLRRKILKGDKIINLFER